MDIGRRAGERIRQRRRAKHIPAGAFAKSLGITPTTLYKIEHGINSSMSVDRLYEIAEALDVHPYLLLGGEDEIYTLLEKEEQSRVAAKTVATMLVELQSLLEGEPEHAA